MLPPHSNRIYYNLCFSLFQVSYCENDVDCRRLLQLIHFGEKFDTGNCKKTCDTCSKIKGFTEKDVTETAKQMVRWFFSISLDTLSCHVGPI